MKNWLRNNRMVVLIGTVVLVAVVIGVIVYVRTQQTTTTDQSAVAQEVSQLVSAGDIAACDAVSDATYKVVCKNNIALKKAQETEDFSWCTALDDKRASRESCAKSVLAQKISTATTTTVCDALSGTSFASLTGDCRQSFWTNQAIQESNQTLCDNLEGKQADACRSKFVAGNFFINPSARDCGDTNGLLVNTGECEDFKTKVQTDPDNTCAIFAGTNLVAFSECNRARSKL